MMGAIFCFKLMIKGLTKARSCDKIVITGNNNKVFILLVRSTSILDGIN